MEVKYNNDSPLRLICEFINTHKYINILHELIEKPENIIISFSDKNAVSLNTICYNTKDVMHVLCIGDNTPSLTEQQKVEAVQFLCSRYINLIKEFIFNELENSGKFSDQTFKSYSSMLIGRFREHVMESTAEKGNELYEILIENDTDTIEKNIKVFRMESRLGMGDSKEEKALLNLICEPYLEKNRYFNNEDKVNEENHNYYSKTYRNTDSLRSLVIPNMDTVESLERYKLSSPIIEDDGSSYIEATHLNSYIESMIEARLAHHVRNLGEDGKILKKKIYSDYGVTPHLRGSTNKTSEQVRQYDETIKDIEDKLSISQIIVISFMMNLRYMKDGEGFEHTTRIHQIISSPNSDITVPYEFIKELQNLIKNYAEETALSDDEVGNKDSQLIKLIELFLYSRFGLPTLNEYNNFHLLIEDIKFSVEELIVYGSDYISLLNIDKLTDKLTSTYNEWLCDTNIDDSSVNYKIYYDNNIEQLHKKLEISENKLKRLYDISSNESIVKKRFRAIL